MIDVKAKSSASEKESFQLGNFLKNAVFDNIVPIMFIIICLAGVVISKLPLAFIMNELVTRLARNVFVVLALIIPVLAGMGLNFAIVLGAMAGQMAIVAVTHWEIGGIAGILLIALLSTPLSIIFGYLTGVLLNKTKGQEMITSMILGFFANGIYQLIFLFFIGTIIPMNNPVLILSGGMGVKNTIDLPSIKYAIDNIIKWNLPKTLFVVGIVAILVVVAIMLFTKFVRKSEIKNMKTHMIYLVGGFILTVWGYVTMNTSNLLSIVMIPVGTFLVIAVLCLFNVFIVKTKLGQEFRTVGQDMHIAKVSGIQVDKIRIIAIVLSTVLAGWGQIIFLQNLGTLNTYGSHEQVGMFAVAALLIGGASVTRASIGHAIMGTLLFHTLFIVSPVAGKNLFGSAEIGEYFRAFVAYGVIGVSLGLYAWKQQVQKKQNKK